MSGHSKWANIKHKKAAVDAKKGKAFTKLSREITVVAREGGGEPDNNPRLRLLMEKGRKLNMPLENITRAIKKGTGELPGASYEAITYEGYGPNGIAVIVDALTDNKNRTAAEMRSMFTSNNGSLGETNSVSWMFSKMGVIQANGSSISEDELLEKLIDYDINDIKSDSEWMTIYCDSKSLDKVKQAVAQIGFNIESAQVEWVAKTNTELPTEKAEKAYSFLEELDDQDDVQNVYTNLA